jgi:hypothetical protein
MWKYGASTDAADGIGSSSAKIQTRERRGGRLIFYYLNAARVSATTLSAPRATPEALWRHTTFSGGNPTMNDEFEPVNVSGLFRQTRPRIEADFTRTLTAIKRPQATTESESG